MRQWSKKNLRRRLLLASAPLGIGIGVLASIPSTYPQPPTPTPGTIAQFPTPSTTVLVESASESLSLFPPDWLTELVAELKRQEATEATTTTVTIPKVTTTSSPPYLPPAVADSTATVGSDLSSPPRTTDTLDGCIAYYESTWGDLSRNFFQFTDGTWAVYGGKGSPANATYKRQLEVFWLAWEDDGPNHWLAQKGRCF